MQDNTDAISESLDFAAEHERIFEEEQAHLNKVCDKLDDIERELTATLSAISEEAGQDIANMRDELFLGTADFDQTLETLAEFELMNHVIDSYNISNDINQEKLARAITLRKKPYFGKVTLRFKPGSEPKDIYLGVAGMTDENLRHFIVDWRSPVAEVYYNQENGPTSYEANGRTITCDLLTRRQFDLEGRNLKSCFDTTIAIQDPLLLQSLARERSSKLSVITTTIQKEQNRVIRHADVPALLVDGIAGSGKTSVLLQRIAYLFYRYREELSPENVCLITPNPVFGRYIDSVLPEMGEKNPRIFTYRDLMEKLGRADGSAGDNATVEDLRAIDAAIPTVTFDQKDFCDIRIGSIVAASGNQAFSILKRFSKRIEPGPRLIKVTCDELTEKLEAKIASLATSDAIHDEMMALSPAEQSRLFGHQLFPQDEDEFKDLAKRYLESILEPAFRAIENAEWMRLDRIGMRMLKKEGISNAEWAYLKTALAGVSEYEVRYVMVDEVQDYTEAQLLMMARYFRNAHFMLLGDENQAVKAGSANFDRILDLFRQLRGQADVCKLTTSYRSSPEITQLFASLLPPASGIEISSVQPSCSQPVIRACVSDEYEAALSKAVEDYRAMDGLTAVICSGSKAAKKLAPLCGDALLMLGDEVLPQQGVVILSVDTAKGLEFDHVVVADADAKRYPNTEVSRCRLYTSISRATHHVTVLSNGDMTDWLSRFVN